MVIWEQLLRHGETLPTEGEKAHIYEDVGKQGD